ncbi:class I SAM-dependent methyltransferase [Streptomyces sp. NPDC058486]|uniref:class I SAM-dependent methyltransferase n=1 Tax=unclassified Streptomyces TaxID=2593676 RepID=UPI0036672539
MSIPVDVSKWETHYAAGRDFRPVLDEEMTAFDESVPESLGRRALDIGCGTGGFARFLRTRDFTVLGLDCSESAVSKATATSRNLQGISFSKWNAETDSWQNIPTVDLISCRLSYAFIQDKKKFLQNVWENLVPGGIFYVMTPMSQELPTERKATGISRAEGAELCEGWASVRELQLDAHHVRYALTRGAD